MQPNNLQRLLRALVRQGLDVSYNNKTYSVGLSKNSYFSVAEALLPSGLLVEAGAGAPRHRLIHSAAKVRLTGVNCITLRQERRIEEAPAAYKSIQSVIDVQVSPFIYQKISVLTSLIATQLLFANSSITPVVLLNTSQPTVLTKQLNAEAANSLGQLQKLFSIFTTKNPKHPQEKNIPIRILITSS